MRSGPRCTRLPTKWTSTINCGMQVRLYSTIPAVPTVKPLFFFVCRWQGTNCNGPLQELEGRGSPSLGVLGVQVHEGTMSGQLRLGRHHRRLVGCGAPNWSDISKHCSTPPHSGLWVARGAVCHYISCLRHVRNSAGNNGQIHASVATTLGTTPLCTSLQLALFGASTVKNQEMAPCEQATPNIGIPS